MKIARIILTATMLISLKSTLFCSAPSAASEEPVILEKPDSYDIPVIKKPGYDASKKGWLGTSNQWMLDHMGENYKYFTTECQVRPESDDEDETKTNGSKARWAKIGKEDVKSALHAEKFLLYTAKLNLPADANQPSLDLIAADKRRKIANSIQTFKAMQEESRALLSAILIQDAEEKAETTQRTLYFNNKIAEIKAQKAAEFKAREQLQIERNTKNINDLKLSLEETKAFRKAHNECFPDHTIQAEPVVKREDITKLTATNLIAIAEKYDRALKKAIQETNKIASTKDAAK